MSIPKKVKNYLDKNQAKYDEVLHRKVYTAYDAAQTLKKELKEVAKNLLIKADKGYALIVVPADRKLNLNKIKKALGAKKVSIPKEKDMIKVLKIKPGAISSFGKLHKVDVWVDKNLAKVKKVLLSTGSVTDSVVMKIKDFIDMEEANLADLAEKGGYKLQKNNKKKKKAKKSTQGSRSKAKPKRKVASKKSKSIKRKITTKAKATKTKK